MTANPLKLDTPSILRYNYPTPKLNPKADEQLLIGKRVSLLKNLDEKKNIALASLATAGIFFVGSLFAFFMIAPALGTIMAIPAVILGTSGSLFFVLKKYLDPKQQIEFDKDELRFAIFEKVIQYNSDKLEGYDLLERAIEDRSKDEKDKKSVYIAIRQLKRHLNKLNVERSKFEKEVNDKYNEAYKKLRNIKNNMIILVSASSQDAKNAQIFQINNAFDEALKPWFNWRKESLEKISTEYKNGVEKLNLEYDKLLNNLGKKPIGWKDYLWDKTPGLPWKKKA